MLLWETVQREKGLRIHQRTCKTIEGLAKNSTGKF